MEKSIEIDPAYYDLGRDDYVDSDFASETTSLSSSVYRGVFENGRRCPSDEQQFESLEASKSWTSAQAEAPGPCTSKLFLSQHQLTKYSDVSDMFPNATVRGVDLFPPPVNWLPPNCTMEVDDVLQEWTWHHPFDLIHMRQLIGVFTPVEWDSLFTQCYKNLSPGGWIEQLEGDPRIHCSDSSMLTDSSMVQFTEAVFRAGQNWNHPLDTLDTMHAAMEKAGFVDIQEKTYRWPIGPWARDPTLKEAGRLHYHQWTAGMEGWGLYLLTKFGLPRPWTKEEVLVLLARVRKEWQDPHVHMWQYARRVWGRKPTQEEVEGKVRSEEIVKDSEM
ncbi:unnamed protein product [Penicillium nalgiovense]|uniref:Uncharacterized protein n=1 Tax=Penicillium nalgiovense TaxID=60175 RepID=A0A9W4N6J7_PENNA|nr:unnamed protein product [Penicillium nalgiovense]CAG7961461.1 unnamed protein product [Penicillium nalgiovense]CAG7972389.1 unnamed protein product [Penicillium nalgiovense]CAG7974155.1 unnamed protein product [Penicillium nalgiovense]CAG7974314.1 unnamed protein product [Penicillium nalgiovense]